MGKLLGLDSKLTSKVIRHTWASVGFEKFESIDTIGQGLGHTNDPKITKIYAKDLKRKRMDQVNSVITKRKSSINSVDWKLKINLFENFRQASARGFEVNDFKLRLHKKLESYRSDLSKVLNGSFDKWDGIVGELKDRRFKDYEDFDTWVNTLTEFCEDKDIWLITKQYV